MNFAVLAVLVFCSLITDFRLSRISNSLILASIAAGLSTACYSGGAGLLQWISGIVLPLILLFGLFALRMLGAGDIKLFCAIGALMGPVFVINVLLYSFLSGGIIAAALMLYRRNLLERTGFFLNYVKTCFITGTIKPYESGTNEKDGSRFPFAAAAACGTLIAVLGTLF